MAQPKRRDSPSPAHSCQECKHFHYSREESDSAPPCRCDIARAEQAVRPPPRSNKKGPGTLEALKSAPDNGIPEGAAEVHQRRENNTLALRTGMRVLRRISRNRMSPKKLQQIGGANSCRDPFDHDPSDTAIWPDQNNCRDGNPAPLL